VRPISKVIPGRPQPRRFAWSLAVPGVLVLSEFAGAAQSLGAGAILVNPWNITDMAAAIEDALTMSEQVIMNLE
jgi:trehalose-6-phosphate synthase